MSQLTSFTKHPKLFITAWHIHVAAKWQILITQSFQRFSVLFQDATLNWYWNETTSNWERKSLLCLWIRFQPCYICFLELNKKNETKKLKTNCIQTNNWQYDFLPLKNNLENRVNGTEIMWRVRKCLTLKTETKYSS